MSDTQPKAQGQNIRQGVTDFAQSAQKVAGERIAQVRDQARTYSEGAVEQYGQARTHVVERIQDKPVTSVLAVLGVGVVLGVLIGLSAQRSYD